MVPQAPGGRGCRLWHETEANRKKMRHRYLKITAFVVLCIALLGALSACKGMTSYEDQVRKVVYKARDAVEAKNVSHFMRHVATNYTDDYGNDYESLRALLFADFMRPGAIKVFIIGLDVEVSGMAARVEGKAVVVRGRDLSNVKSIGDVIPDEADAFEFSFIFTNNGSKWQVVGGNWQPVGLAGLL